MTCLSGIRSFPKLWKSKPYFGVGPGHSYLSLFLRGSGIKNQQRSFSLKTMSLQNTKAVNMLAAKGRFVNKGDKESIKRISARPSHLFAAGEAKKRSQMNPSDQHQTLLPKKNNIELPTKPLSSEEWDKLKEDYTGKNFENWISAQMSQNHSSVDVAKSLLAWVAAKNNGIVGYNLLVMYLHLCVFHKQTSEVIDVYEIMKARYKSLEPGAYTLLIRGLIHSDRWREAFQVLEEVKKIMTPSVRNYDDCIQGALLHQDVNMAWNFYEELLSQKFTPTLETLKSFFDFGKGIKDDYYSNKLLDMLLYLRNNHLYPGESLAHSIKTWFESGQCSGCGNTIESIHLSPEDYDFLKEKIMRDVIDGGDRYRKTTPKELKTFENFIKSCPPFDIVIDGLNVAKMHPKARESEFVSTKLSFKELQYLTLSRIKSMVNSSVSCLLDLCDYVLSPARFSSEDDPFLLYATLNSGNNCQFITNDLMRDHKACLLDTKTQRLFFKWHVFPGSHITFQPVLSYDTVVQTTGDSWHIPYDSDLVERYSYEVPTKWLCLHRRTR
uniref:ribonuclease P n=1 Tax=Cavia porcellus TaxID=10141 RepID=A0A286XBG0_CAVPO